jgi:hypothetical protein
MKAYLSLLVVAAILGAAGCDESNKRRRHRSDGGEGGEAGAAEGGTGLLPAGSAGSAGRSNATAGAAGSMNPAGSGGSGNQGSGGTPNSGGSAADGNAGEPSSGGSTGAAPSSGGSGAQGGSDGGSPPSSGGSSGTGANAGTGGSDPCGCTSSQACDETGTCVERAAIDDFATCDEAIPLIEGRSGTWGDFGSAAITYSVGFGDPGEAFNDHSCAAWMTGGGEAVTTSDYAGVFVMLEDSAGIEGGGPYSLSGHTGIRIAIESVHQLVLQVRTVGDGYFGIVLTPDGLPVTTYDIPFSYMSVLDHSALSVFDLTQVTQIQVTVVPAALAGFAFAVHYVGVY